MAAPAAAPGILALLRALGIGAEAAPSAVGAVTGMTRAQQLARAATAEKQAGRTAIQQRMDAMANRGAGANAPAPVGAPNAMSPAGSTIVGGAALPMAGSLFPSFPQRAEGDPASAYNRSNAPTNYGSNLMFDRPGLPDDTLGGFPSSYGSDLMPDRPGLPDDTLGGFAAPTAFRRPPASQPAASAPAAAAADPSFMSRLFGGQDFQSNNQAVVSRPQGPMADGSPQRTTLNFGDSDNAADFFRADKAMQELQRNKEDFVGMASGGAANGSNGKASNGRDAALHKALEIIHHMMVNRR